MTFNWNQGGNLTWSVSADVEPGVWGWGQVRSFPKRLVMGELSTLLVRRVPDLVNSGVPGGRSTNKTRVGQLLLLFMVIPGHTHTTSAPSGLVWSWENTHPENTSDSTLHCRHAYILQEPTIFGATRSCSVSVPFHSVGSPSHRPTVLKCFKHGRLDETRVLHSGGHPHDSSHDSYSHP